MIGSRHTTREAFKRGLVADGEIWMEMIKARNLTSQTYIQTTAEEIVEDILTRFYPAFAQLGRKFTALLEHAEDE